MYLLDHSPVFFVVALVVLLLMQELGFRLRALANGFDEKRRDRRIRDVRNQVALVLGLLLVFAAWMALTRFEERKRLVIAETNAIGAAHRLAGLQSEPLRGIADLLLYQYADSRIAIFGGEGDASARKNAMIVSRQIQDTLWRGAVAAVRESQAPAETSYAQILSHMISVDRARMAAGFNRIPFGIWILLALLAVTTSLALGFGQRERSMLAGCVPLLMVAITMSLIADLDSPMSGFIQVEQQSLRSLSVDLRVRSSGPTD